MKSLGICDRRYLDTTWRVVRSEPILCPPRVSDRVLLARWTSAEFIYIDLHGREQSPAWLYAGTEQVLHYSQLANLPGGKVIFATTCYLPQTAFLDVLRRGSTVVYGAGQNYGGHTGAMGAPLLGLWFRRFIERGFNPRTSLALAKARLVLTSFRSADQDALQFKITGPS